MADLRHLLAIYVHAHRAGNAVPPHIDADARAALAAEPPAPGPTINDIWELCEDHEFHLGEGFDDEASAEIMLQIIRVALTRWGRPAPAPAADGEREELADDLGWIAARLSDIGWGDDSASVARAATLLREPAPAPVPVAERPWERPGWCDAEGCLWLWDSDRRWVRQTGTAGACNTWTGSFALPHWAIPQPPQGGEVGE